jgi:methylenetetrahydrofolate dehydrogenase (NADP+)/methenyltetrahydrofolate cyclohydrolase
VTAIKLDGEAVAARIKDELRGRVAAVTAARGTPPGLATLLVGDDGPSHKYVSMKHADAADLGIATFDERLPADTPVEAIETVIDGWNAAPDVDAVLPQYPFPAHFAYEALFRRIDPDKDADGLHPVNLGRLVMGVDAPVACTPAGIVALLAAYDVPIEGRHVVIVGRGLTIGRPLANLLALKRPNANAAVTVVHTGVPDIGAYTRRADILVAAAGSPHLITADMVKPGAAVVAAGVSFAGKKVVSDVAPEVAEVAGWLSPRIGGVGPLTRALLFVNTVAAAERATATA